jgi:hypothetical protein
VTRRLLDLRFLLKPHPGNFLIEDFAAIKNPPVGGFFIAACAVIT